MTAIFAHVRLLLDVVFMKIFVWVFGHEGELLDSHLFFFDRYSDLADYHRQQGRIAKADRLAVVAEAYFRAAPGDDEPPAAAAMAMPAPRPFTSTNAVSVARTKNRVIDQRHPSRQVQDRDFHAAAAEALRSGTIANKDVDLVPFDRGAGIGDREHLRTMGSETGHADGCTKGQHLRVGRDNAAPGQRA